MPAELLDSFEDYVADLKWFEFLRVQAIILFRIPKAPMMLFRKIIKESSR